MSKRIGVLFKVLSKETYKQDFLDGVLYMNTIDYFRNYEELEQGNIADKYEAISNWMHPQEFKLEIEVNGVKHVLNPEDMASPMTVSMNVHNHANVFCMTHLHSHDIDMESKLTETEEALVRSYFTLPQEVEKLGEYMVVITNPSELLRRFVDEASRLHLAKDVFWYSSEQVKYYDEKKSSLILENMMDAPFYKQSKYAHQNEYRFCLIRDNPKNEPFKMNIGSIRDIAMEIKTKDFNSLLELRKPE